jgi:serine/threonine protein kinase
MRKGMGSFHGNYRLGEKLGEGNFGQVRIAKLRSSKDVRAVKIIDVRSSGLAGSPDDVDDEKLKDAMIEAKAMQRVSGHKHCVEFFETFADQSLFYIVMEKCKVSLMDRLESMSCVSEHYLARLFREILLGVSHVHQASVVHRDIKPDNILLGGADGDTVKLTDFGMAQEMTSRGYLTSRCGTAPYMSPEIVSSQPYDFRTDVWSVGITAYVLLYGDFPYVPKVHSSRAMKEAIFRGEPAPNFTPASKSAPEPSRRAGIFTQTLMAREKSNRCTSVLALQLPFVSTDQPPPPDQANDLTPSFKLARQNTLAFPKSDAKLLDPTVAKDLDDLLGTRQAKLNGSFSEPVGAECTAHLSGSNEDTISTCSSAQLMDSDSGGSDSPVQTMIF